MMTSSQNKEVKSDISRLLREPQNRLTEHRTVVTNGNSTLNIRMVALSIGLLFGLTVVLFSWNIFLWRETHGLKEEISSLKQYLAKSEAKMKDFQDNMKRRFHNMKRRQSLTETHERETTAQEKDVPMPSNKVLRSKRSIEEDLSIPPPSQNILTRNVRRASRKNCPKGKRKNCKKNKRRKSADVGGSSPALQPATAVHVTIAGSAPYKSVPSRTAAEGARGPGLLRWGNFWNQGFNTNLLNAENGSAGVVVKTTGVYFIYSQVVFTLAQGIEFHEKILIEAAGRSELASCVYSRAATGSDGDSTDYVTCNSYGVARMEEGSKFSVRIHTNDLEVYDNPHYTYFGAFLIGGATN